MIKSTLERFPFYNDLVKPYHALQAIIAQQKYHHPSKHLKVIGVTGTNGKTTTCFMIWHMLNQAGLKTGLMTTVAHGVDHLAPELNHMTTVDALTLERRIQEIKNQGAQYLVLEVTSHALAEYRTLGIHFDIAVMTNLTHEHLDYHKTFANYRAAKAKLIQKADLAILNADDSNCAYYQQKAKKYITYGIENGQNRAKSIKLGINGVKYSLGDINSTTSGQKSAALSQKATIPAQNSTPSGTAPLAIETSIPGEFNVYNSMAAALVGQQLGLTPNQIENGIKSLQAVEGRMTIIDEGQPFTVIVDYAHAPDALEKVFESVENHNGRIISVHGGAGRRDPSTRPIRGRILAKYSDIVIITEDDSRDEDPAQIAEAFLTGAKKQGKILGQDLFYIPNREDAIAQALNLAKKGDLVLILGKGHEKTILRSDGPHTFEDIKVTRKLLKKLHP